MIIPYDIFKAACACTGNDPGRSQIFWQILITPEGQMVSTDGHVMYVSNPLHEAAPGLFVIHGTPEPCVVVDLRVADGIAVGMNADGGTAFRYPVEPRDPAGFLDWRRGTWETSPEPGNPKIGWSLTVLKKLIVVFESENWFTYESGGPLAPAKVTGRHGTVWIAPCKV